MIQTNYKNLKKDEVKEPKEANVYRTTFLNYVI